MERFDIELNGFEDGLTRVVSPHGQYVKYKDYASLKAQLAQVTKELEKAKVFYDGVACEVCFTNSWEPIEKEDPQSVCMKTNGPVEWWRCLCCWQKQQLAQVMADRTKFIEAVGLASTLKGNMQIDINDPVGMMQQVHEHVTQQLAQVTAQVENLQENLKAAHTCQELLKQQLASIRRETLENCWKHLRLLMQRQETVHEQDLDEFEEWLVKEKTS